MTELVETCEVDQDAAEVEEQNIESRNVFHGSSSHWEKGAGRPGARI